MMLKVLTLLLCSVVVVAMSQVASGQETQGRIKGTVKDSDGAAVSGVDVSLLLPNQAVARATVTDAEGNFTFENVPPGSYEISLDRTGFLRHRSAVRVTSSETRDLNIVLEVTPDRRERHDNR